jgi:hypothetical protein
VSYDLAVWEGEVPESDAAAAAIFQRLYRELIEDAAGAVTPTPAIVAYVDGLLERWPDITEAGGDDSPWSDGPLIGNASGTLVYFGMVFSMADEAAAFAVELAQEHGLVCYDPQLDALRSS